MKRDIHTQAIGKTELIPLTFCGKNIGWELHSEGGFYILPYEVEPTEGEHDFNKCEGCQKSIKVISEILTEKLKTFPLCCSYHTNLAKVKEFNRASFANIPEMVARKVIYTNQHIINNKSSDNWYKIITDYIEHVYDSFGQMPNGCGEPLFLSSYFSYVVDNIEKQYEGKYLKPEIKKRILEIINLYTSPVKHAETDLNILLGTYQKWFKEFPFDLNSYFGNLKEQYEKQIPIFNGKPEVNIYSGITKVKLHTKSSLIDALIKLTDNLLTQINGVTLFENGLITNANKINLELAIESRKLKIKQGYKNSSKDEEQQYRKILKEWLNDEKVFIDRITPLINSESDCDFIKGQITLEFTPQGNTGYFMVTKGEARRKFTIEIYYDLDLRNWEYEIDKASTKIEKKQIANNAIFRFRKELLNEKHPLIISTIEEKINHLQNIIEYIDSTFDETFQLQQTETKPTITAYAIMHVYLAMFNGQPVTQQNKNELAKRYGYNSGDQLRNDFTQFQNEDKRLDLNTTNKRSANTHLQRIKDILPILERENNKAYNKAKTELVELEKIYNKHY